MTIGLIVAVSIQGEARGYMSFVVISLTMRAEIEDIFVFLEGPSRAVQMIADGVITSGVEN